MTGCCGVCCRRVLGEEGNGTGERSGEEGGLLMGVREGMTGIK